MINQGLGLAHLFGLFFLSAIFGVDIDIRQDIPSQLSPGEEVIVSVEISKGDIQGFAKLQLEVPTGLTISAVETQGASFTFADQKAKFIWMALPPEESFTVSYNLQVSQTAIGLKELSGRFSYIEDNERKIHQLGVSTMDIQDAGRTAAEGDLITSTEEETPELDNALIGSTGPVSYPFELLEAIQGPGDVSAERKITRSGPQDFLVEVSLNKGDIRGFGKLQETIPTGFIAMEKRSADAIFTTQGEVVKFVWLNLPPDEILEVSYKLRVINATEPHYKIDGEFGYLLNDETQKATLASTPFSMEEEVMAQNEPAEESPASEEPIQEEENEPVVEVEPVEAMNEVSNEPQETEEPETPEVEEVVAVQETPEPKDVVAEPEEEEVFVEEVEPVSNVPSPEHGVTYKVQITAAHKDVGREYFISRHKFYDDFGIERHQGWTKYLTGKYGKYADARNRRNDLVNKGHKFPGPFVTAYNDGQRITVQEALMISNQKWVQ